MTKLICTIYFRDETPITNTKRFMEIVFITHKSKSISSENPNCYYLPTLRLRLSVKRIDANVKLNDEIHISVRETEISDKIPYLCRCFTSYSTTKYAFSFLKYLDQFSPGRKKNN